MTSFFADSSRASTFDRVLFTELLEVIDPEPHAGPLNMAVDEVLLQEAEQPSLRIYRWSQPTVSFGYFGRIGEAEGAARGRAMVRRWTGGGIVEHGEDLAYTLLIPRTHSFFRHAAPESYRLIHEVIACLMGEEGMEVEVAPIAGKSVDSACFTSPVQYDLVARGVKIAGAAQRRTRWGLLHQGSIQSSNLFPGLDEKLASAFGGKVHRGSLDPSLQDAAATLAAAKYGTTAWLRKY